MKTSCLFNRIIYKALEEYNKKEKYTYILNYNYFRVYYKII